MLKNLGIGLFIFFSLRPVSCELECNSSLSVSCQQICQNLICNECIQFHELATKVLSFTKNIDTCIESLSESTIKQINKTIIHKQESSSFFALLKVNSIDTQSRKYLVQRQISLGNAVLEDTALKIFEGRRLLSDIFQPRFIKF